MKINPLVWEKHEDVAEWWTVHEGCKPGISMYQMYPDDYGNLDGAWWLIILNAHTGTYSFDDAKSAAQSDYESRILAALDTAPPTRIVGAAVGASEVEKT